ncbi:hypothetical protein [Methyloterricola oryzae]|uniref:hypothetical protein n=1 Tax=Methyloterricola oryzae TaxID=1495050 RepID=UPI001300D077|nr:hypothetical protein [Methyloterricola oryzae]
MEVIVTVLLGLWMGLGLPVVERGETANCRPPEEARIVYKDLTRPYAEEAYYPVMGCRP